MMYQLRLLNDEGEYMQEVINDFDPECWHAAWKTAWACKDADLFWYDGEGAEPVNVLTECNVPYEPTNSEFDTTTYFGAWRGDDEDLDWD